MLSQVQAGDLASSTDASNIRKAARELLTLPKIVNVPSYLFKRVRSTPVSNQLSYRWRQLKPS
jgi:hypothetical protein